MGDSTKIQNGQSERIRTSCCDKLKTHKKRWKPTVIEGRIRAAIIAGAVQVLTRIAGAASGFYSASTHMPKHIRIKTNSKPNRNNNNTSKRQTGYTHTQFKVTIDFLAKMIKS